MMFPEQPILELIDIEKQYVLRSTLLQRLRESVPKLQAVSGVSLTIQPGEIVGLVGESGSGKSTLGKMIVRLIRPSAGRIIYRGTDVSGLEGKRLRPYRHSVQMIFQDSHSSLNPRKRVGRMVDEALAARGLPRESRDDETKRLIELVGLDPSIGSRYPHELSGGQRQRIGIARSLAMKPELLVADEPVSALDVSLQGQIINLLTTLSSELGLAMLFISHDLAVVKRISNRIAVMHAGRIVELGRPDDVMANPAHPYTRSLIDAVPRGLDGRARRGVPAPSSHDRVHNLAIP